MADLIKGCSAKAVSEKTRAEDERLRRELEKADPEKFKRLVRPLFRSSKTKQSDSQGAKANR